MRIRDWSSDVCSSDRIALGFEAEDTRSNATEVATWAQRRKYKSIRLVTTDWHMRRAEYEIGRAVGDTVTILPDAVRSRPSFATLFREYHTYLAWLAGGLLGLSRTSEERRVGEKWYITGQTRG